MRAETGRRMNVAALRLACQGLPAPRFENPGEVVRWLGAVQAQDYAMAKWAVGLRMRRATDDQVEQAFNQGRVLRTHVMRPTWHFVVPEDIRWMLRLTAPRVKAVLARSDPELEITGTLLARCFDIFAGALAGGKALTRTELAAHLARRRIVARGRRLGHIMVHAELEGLLCSGPRRRKQLTYTLLEERVPPAREPGRDEALAALVRRYFSSHGPAQLHDFAWWSGLSGADAREALGLVRSDLAEATVGGRTYWYAPRSGAAARPTSTAHLLSIYDEYIVAYRDRSAVSDRRDAERLLSMGNALTAVLVIHGRIAARGNARPARPASRCG